MSCDQFWSNSEGDKTRCICDAMAMPHKYSPICQLYEITHRALRKRDNAGIKSQKHILKELDKRMSQKHNTICDKKRKKK
jgi:hypothetical protein